MMGCDINEERRMWCGQVQGWEAGGQDCGVDRSEDEKRGDKSLTGCCSGFKWWDAGELSDLA